MAQKTVSMKRLAARDKADRTQIELATDVVKIFEAARFKVLVSGQSRRTLFRMTAIGHDLEREWRIDVVLSDHVRGIDVERAIRMHRPSAIARHVNELWVIGNTLGKEIYQERDDLVPGVRVYTVHELRKSLVAYGQETLRQPKPETQRPRQTRSKPRTNIGKAVIANKEQIMVAIVALLAQLDGRIDSLRNERPNSDDAIKKRDLELNAFERMRHELEHIKKMVAEYTKGQVPEPRATKPIKAFAEGLGEWWTKDHVTICNQAYTFGLFASALTICSIAGAGGTLSTTIAGAMYGGKPVVDALKAIFKSKRAG